MVGKSLKSYTPPGLLSEATRFEILDAIIVVAGIAFVTLAIRQAWRVHRRGRPGYAASCEMAQAAALKTGTGAANSCCRRRHCGNRHRCWSDRLSLAYTEPRAPVAEPRRSHHGDTIVVAGEHVRLNGVDAEEVAHRLRLQRDGWRERRQLRPVRQSTASSTAITRGEILRRVTGGDRAPEGTGAAGR